MRVESRRAGRFVTLLLLLGSACTHPAREASRGAEGRGDRTPRTGSDRLTSLADSIAPLRDQFNAERDKLRLVALLSPT